MLVSLIYDDQDSICARGRLRGREAHSVASDIDPTKAQVVKENIANPAKNTHLESYITQPQRRCCGYSAFFAD
jgi:hypothetical protein